MLESKLGKWIKGGVLASAFLFTVGCGGQRTQVFQDVKNEISHQQDIETGEARLEDIYIGIKDGVDAIQDTDQDLSEGEETTPFDISGICPTISNIEPLYSVKENETLEISLEVENGLDFSLKEGSPEGATFVDGNFSWTPSYEFVKHPELEKKVMVGLKVYNEECLLHDHVWINVIDVNRHPTIEFDMSDPKIEGQEFYIQAYAMDADEEDVLELSAKLLGYEFNEDPLPEWILEVEDNNDLLNLTANPGCEDAGDYIMRFNVSDGLEDVFIVDHFTVKEGCGCLEGQIEKVECCPEDNLDCNLNPCKSYQTEECVNGEWVETSECESFDLVYEYVGGISQWEDQLSFVRYFDGAQFYVADLTTKNITEIEGTDHSQLVDLKTNAGKVLISDCQKMYVFDTQTEMLKEIEYGSPNIFSVTDNGTGCELHTTCVDLNEELVVCRETLDEGICVTSYDLGTGERTTQYCSDATGNGETGIVGSEMHLFDNTVFFQLYNGSQAEQITRIASLDLDTKELNLLVEEETNCLYNGLDFLVSPSWLVFSNDKNEECGYFPWLNAEQEIFYLDDSLVPNSLTEETGFACGIKPHYSGLLGDSLVCSTGPENNYELKMIDLKTKQETTVTEGAYYTSISGSWLSFEKQGHLYSCELKDEWLE